MTTTSDPMVATLAAHRAATSPAARVGVYSVCSAHPWVLAAAVRQACDDGTAVLIEATSNQVNQDGGYTGMRPADFRDLVLGIAEEHGLPRERVVLGGDHLGPNVWRSLGSEEAMRRAEVLVVAYVEAGFTKIHLDCSMACAGERDPLTDEVVASRAARLARAAETAAGRHKDRLGYVIGTEVPVPGGAHETIDSLAPTSPTNARATIEAHRAAFVGAGLEEAWQRVLAVVVQPGVEFDHQRVFDYDPMAVRELRSVVEDYTLVFEAHSTDYQLRSGLRALVEDHWAVLKVGPGLTFALREAMFALASIEDELVPTSQRSGLVEVVERVMLQEPRWWLGYYEGDAAAQRVARRYSYSDRMRYYWPYPAIQSAQECLLTNLQRTGIPLPLLSAHLPGQYERVRHGELEADPQALVVDRVRDVLREYAAACATGMHPR
ncbi:MAG: D-tagatose-bisphosphate aldolase, class II, non-catalytic subunit [Nocardioides sp.]